MTIRSLLQDIAEIRAEVDDYGWEAACDRMAMDIIAGDPGTAARTYHVTLYREVCEYARSRKKAVDT